MAKCGVNVPPGLTITTEVCQEFYRVGEFQQIFCPGSCSIMRRCSSTLQLGLSLAMRKLSGWSVVSVSCAWWLFFIAFHKVVGAAAYSSTAAAAAAKGYYSSCCLVCMFAAHYLHPCLFAVIL